MTSWRRNLCRRRYDELSSRFFAEIDEICRRNHYSKEHVDRSMKRVLKIAESRDPTPNDMSRSTESSNITKEHLDYFFKLFRSLVQQPVVDVEVNTEEEESAENLSDTESMPSLNQDFLPSPSDTDSSVENRVARMCSGSDDSEDEDGAEQFEVERIISRTVNAAGKYVYHIKWAGYETSSDPENFVEEENMNCPDLIAAFERMEREKKKERAKKLEQQALLAKQKKLEAERRNKLAAIFNPGGSSDSDRERNTCKVLDLCSSSSSSSDGEYQELHPYVPGSGKKQTASKKCGASLASVEKARQIQYQGGPGNVGSSAFQAPSKQDKKKHRQQASANMMKQNISSASEDEEEQSFASSKQKRGCRQRSGRRARKHSEKALDQDDSSRKESSRSACASELESSCKEERSHTAPSSRAAEECCLKKAVKNTIDPSVAYKYMSRETDGFQKGYKVVKVNVVTEHPIHRNTVGVVVFKDPEDGHEFAQYIPLREVHMNAPAELRQYFLRVQGMDPKTIALSLLLQTPNKAS